MVAPAHHAACTPDRWDGTDAQVQGYSHQSSGSARTAGFHCQTPRFEAGYQACRSGRGVYDQHTASHSWRPKIKELIIMPRGGRPGKRKAAKMGHTTGRRGGTGNSRRPQPHASRMNGAGTKPKTKAHNTNRSGRRY